jgi:hypothetical protein
MDRERRRNQSQIIVSASDGEFNNGGKQRDRKTLRRRKADAPRVS